jgi:hypothetical protein
MSIQTVQHYRLLTFHSDLTNLRTRQLHEQRHERKESVDNITNKELIRYFFENVSDEDTDDELEHDDYEEALWERYQAEKEVLRERLRTEKIRRVAEGESDVKGKYKDESDDDEKNDADLAEELAQLDRDSKEVDARLLPRTKWPTLRLLL